MPTIQSNQAITRTHGQGLEQLRQQRIEAIFGSRTLAQDPVSKKSFPKRVASFFRTLNPFKHNATPVIAKRDKLTVASNSKKHVSAQHTGKLTSQRQKIWSHAKESNPAGVKNLVEFLSALGQTSAMKNPAFKEHANTLLGQLGESSALLDQAMAIATSATATCSDGVTRVFNQLQLASISHDICTGKYNKRVPEALDIARDIFKLECIETIADETIKIRLNKAMASPTLQDYLELDSETFAGMSDEQKKEAILKKIDPIEVHMCYRVELQAPCKITLPAPASMFEKLADLEAADIENAAEQVNRRVEEEFSTWLTKYDPWETLMRQVAPKRHAKMVKASTAILKVVEKNSDSLIVAEIRRTNPDMDDSTIAYLMDDLQTHNRIASIVTDRAVAAVKMQYHREFIGKYVR
jgi:hypothetical protein